MTPALCHSGCVYVTRRELPLGDGATTKTLQTMQSLVNAAISNPIVRKQAVQVVQDAPPRSGGMQIALIRNWLSDHVQFLADPRDQELLHDPVLLVRSIQHNSIIHVDCDDVAILGAALGKAVGLRARFVALAFLAPDAPFSHVYAELASPYTPRWLDLDTTRDVQSISLGLVSRRFVLEV